MRKRKNKQSGFTLSSLLIGINLSLLSILASVNLYSSHSASTKQLRSDSAHNRQIATAMMVIQKELVNAGYGITSGGANDIVAVSSNAGLGSKSVLWRYRDNGVYLCRGIRETGFISDGVEQRYLGRIESVSDCDENTALSTLAWSGVIGSLGQWPVVNKLADYLDDNDSIFKFSITSEVCSPFGMSERVDHLSATISAPTRAELNGVSVPGNSVKICLPNTYP